MILESYWRLLWVDHGQVLTSCAGGKVECIIGVLLYIGFGIVIGANWLRLLRQDRIC